VKGFTSKYKLDRLVYYEQFSDPISAITREKEIKAWRREKENNLVRKLNPKWEDLAKKIIWRKCLTAPLVIPNRADGEGPHQSVGERKLSCVIQYLGRGPSRALGMTED